MTDQKIYIKAATQISMQQPLSEAWLTAPERPNVPYQRSQDPNFRDWLNPLESRRMGKLMKRALVTAQKVMKEKKSIEDNLKTNGVDPAKFHVILGNLIDDEKVQEQVGTERYDIVAANILADVLIPLTPHVVLTMKPGAYYITSGILEGREDSVADAMKRAGLEVISVTAQGEWRCVVGRKPLN